MFLYLDESGQFDVPTDSVSVAGVCTSSRVPDGLIRRALRELCPGWPWPLHTAHLRLPLSLALAAATARRLDPTATTPIDEDADAAINFLRSRPECEGALNHVLGEMESGRWPPFDDVMHLVVALEVAPGNDLSAVRDRLAIARDTLMRSIVEVLSKIPGAQGVAAVERRSGVAGAAYLARKGATKGTITPSATHRYLGLLGPALARAEVIAGVQVQGALAARVANRGVDGIRGLRDDDLKDVSARYGCSTRDLRVVSIDRDAPAPLVLSDVVANTVRFVRRGGLPPYDAALTAALGIPFSSPGADTSTSHVVIVEAP